MVLWWRMVQLELPLWSQSSTTSHTPIHYLQCRSSPLSCRLSRWPCNTSARYQSLPSPLSSAATPRRRWQLSSPTQNAGEDLAREIATTTHQLTTRGTEVRFQWVQAHVCLLGKEKADRAAERGAKAMDSSSVTMKIGLADVYAELNQAGVEAVGEGVPPNGHGHGQGVGRHLSPLQSLLPRSADLPSSHHASSARGRQDMHVRTNGVWVWEERLVSRHVMFTCTAFSDRFKPLTGKLHSMGLPLCTKSLAACVQREGWSLLRAAARLVYTCPLATYL